MPLLRGMPCGAKNCLLDVAVEFQNIRDLAGLLISSLFFFLWLSFLSMPALVNFLSIP